MFKLLLPLLGLFICSSCKSQNPVANVKNDDFNMELLLQDNYSGVVEEELFLIKGQKLYTLFFAKINKTRKPGLAMPKIDFNTSMLLVWCSGETTAPDLDLVLQKETSKTYIISTSDLKSSLKNTAILSPIRIYKLPLSDKNFRFQ